MSSKNGYGFTDIYLLKEKYKKSLERNESRILFLKSKEESLSCEDYRQLGYHEGMNAEIERFLSDLEMVD